MLLNLATKDLKEETAALFRKWFGIKEWVLPVKYSLSKFFSIISLFELPNWRLPGVRCSSDTVPGPVGEGTHLIDVKDRLGLQLPHEEIA